MDWRTDEHKKADKDLWILATFLLSIKDNIVVIRNPPHMTGCDCGGCKMDSAIELAYEIRKKRLRV